MASLNIKECGVCLYYVSKPSLTVSNNNVQGQLNQFHYKRIQQIYKLNENIGTSNNCVVCVIINQMYFQHREILAKHLKNETLKL